MVLLCYEKGMSIDRHHILKTSIKNDKLNILILTNETVIKDSSTDKKQVDTSVSDWIIPVEKEKPSKDKKK